MLKVHLTDEYVFKYKQNYDNLLVNLDHDLFIHKLKNIVCGNYILDTYIPY